MCTLANQGTAHYQPEVGYCEFLDEQYPSTKHFIYACYAREWPVPRLARLYEFLAQRHNVDALIVMDGGSDSLMRGDEDGLGDPLEDACSLGAASLVSLKHKFLLSD